jgi:hypothetical protein
MLEKEFEDGHRGELSKSVFINAKQSKDASSDGRVGRLQECCAGSPKILVSL